MGLKGLFNRLSGNDNANDINADLYVFGEDRRYFRRTMQSTGVYFQDSDNRMAYDSSPAAIGVLTRKANGHERILGPISLAYEPTSRLYNFPTLLWPKEDRHKEDVILDTAFAEGCARAVQKDDRQEWMGRLTTVLLLSVLGATILLLLIAMQSGVLVNVFEKLPNFLG